MGKYRKKPVVIEAMKLEIGNGVKIARWVAESGGHVVYDGRDGTVTISTLEGNMLASVGDWIIQGVQGEFYPCKPDIFAATYEAA